MTLSHIAHCTLLTGHCTVHTTYCTPHTKCRTLHTALPGVVQPWLLCLPEADRDLEQCSVGAVQRQLPGLSTQQYRWCTGVHCTLHRATLSTVHYIVLMYRALHRALYTALYRALCTVLHCALADSCTIKSVKWFARYYQYHIDFSTVRDHKMLSDITMACEDEYCLEAWGPSGYNKCF